MSKRDVASLKERIELFLCNSNLDENQKKEFYSLLESAGGFKNDALILQEKTFAQYIEELIVFRFLFHKNKDENLKDKIEKFVHGFFFLLFPEIDKSNIEIEVKVTAPSQIEIIEKNDLTANLFNTIITTNIIK